MFRKMRLSLLRGKPTLERSYFTLSFPISVSRLGFPIDKDIARYLNQAALDKHRAAPYFQDLIKKAPELLGGPLELKVGNELLQGSAQVVRL
jgi:hypothetical protein